MKYAEKDIPNYAVIHKNCPAEITDNYVGVITTTNAEAAIKALAPLLYIQYSDIKQPFTEAEYKAYVSSKEHAAETSSINKEAAGNVITNVQAVGPTMLISGHSLVSDKNLEFTVYTRAAFEEKYGHKPAAYWAPFKSYIKGWPLELGAL